MNEELRLPRVVACVPVWNAAAFLGPVLAGLGAQTYSNLRIHISVDVSSDDSVQLCERFAATHSNVTVICQTSRLGWIANSNALLATADAEYIFFAMHDDPISPMYVERLVDAMEEHPHAVIAFSDMSSNVGTTFHYDLLEGLSDRFERARRVFHASGSWWVPFRGMMRASTVRELGGLRRHLAGEFSADLLWLLRLAIAGEFVRVSEALVCKRLHANSLSSIWRKGGWNALSLRWACWNNIALARFTFAERAYLFAETVLFACGATRCPGLLRGLKNMLLRGVRASRSRSEVFISGDTS